MAVTVTSRRRFLFRAFATAVVASALGAAVGGCSADDSNAGATDAGSTVDAFASDAEDTGADAETLCTNAPDAAVYSADDIDAGEHVVEAWGCRGCHTVDLSGTTTEIGFAFPKNLTPDVDSGIGCWTDDEIANAVLNGTDDEGKRLCLMPKFAGSIDDAGIAELVAYLRSLPAVPKFVPETSCPSLDSGVDAD